MKIDRDGYVRMLKRFYPEWRVINIIADELFAKVV